MFSSLKMFLSWEVRYVGKRRDSSLTMHGKDYLFLASSGAKPCTPVYRGEGSSSSQIFCSLSS